jgi:hypothetical protein
VSGAPTVTTNNGYNQITPSENGVSVTLAIGGVVQTADYSVGGSLHVTIEPDPGDTDDAEVSISVSGAISLSSEFPNGEATLGISTPSPEASGDLPISGVKPDNKDLGGTFRGKIGASFDIKFSGSGNIGDNEEFYSESRYAALEGNLSVGISVTTNLVTPDAGGPYEISEGDAMALNASATSNPGNLPLTYSWDIKQASSQNWTQDVAEGVNPTVKGNELHVTAANSPYDVRVRVRDDQGFTFFSHPVRFTVLPGLSVKITDLKWSENGDGADVTYEVTGGDLPDKPLLYFFWAKGPQFPGDNIKFAASPISIQRAIDTHLAHIAGSDFTVPPTEATHLLAVVDPDGLKIQKDLPLVVFVPDVRIETEPESPVMGSPYQVKVNVTNKGPVPLSFTMDWTESYLTDPNPTDPSQQGLKLDLGRIDPNSSATIPLGPFNHTWQWIDKKNPLSDPLEEIGIQIEKKLDLEKVKFLLGQLGGVIFNRIDQAIQILGLIDSLLNPVDENDILYDTVVKYGRPGDPVSVSKTVGVEITQYKRSAYFDFLFLNALSSTSLTEGVGAILLGQPEIGIPLLIVGLESLDQARSMYDQAKDPPDPNYKQIANPTTAAVPELDALPSGTLKGYALTALQFEGLKRAQATSQNRAQGAALAGDAEWESRQLVAAADFARQAAALESQLSQLQDQLASEARSLAANSGDIETSLEDQGLPSLAVRLLTERGWTPAEIESLRQNLIAAVPVALANPDNGPIAAELSPLGSAGEAAADLESAIQIRVDKLGQSVSSVSPQDLQAVAQAHASIAADVANGLPFDTLSGEIRAFSDKVQGLILDTNNLAALDGELQFGYSALAHLALPSTTTSPPTPTPTPAPPPSPGSSGTPVPSPVPIPINLLDQSPPANYTSSQRYVYHLYVGLLGRLPDADGLQGFSSLLDQGALSRFQVAQAFLHSQEYLIHTVETLYHRYLHHDADAGGLLASVSFLAGGGTADQLALILASSPEYLAGRAAVSPQDFVRALNADAFDGSLSDAEQATLVGELNQGVSPANALAQLFGCATYQAAAVNRMYQQVLRRNADSGSQQLLVLFLLQGGRSDLLSALLASSDEAYAR